MDGVWYVYVMERGAEKRRVRSKVLGKCIDLTKGAAEEKRRQVISEQRAPVSTATFEELSLWYLKTNKGCWSKKWNVTVGGFFKHHILPELGRRVAAEIKRSEVQQAINAIAASPNCQSSSMVNKGLTQIRAVFEAAVDDEILERHPGKEDCNATNAKSLSKVLDPCRVSAFA